MPSTTINTTTSISDMPAWRRLGDITGFRSDRDRPAVHAKGYPGNGTGLSQAVKGENRRRIQHHSRRGNERVGIPGGNLRKRRGRDDATSIVIEKINPSRAHTHEDPTPMRDP